MQIVGSFGSWGRLRSLDLSLASLAILVLALTMSALPARAYAGTSPSAESWAQAPAASQPGGLAGAAMAYDPATGQLVLYGGEGAGGYSSATWIWSGSKWTEAEVDSPPGALAGEHMAYDALTQQFLLYGGTTAGGSNSDETWSWDGSNWTLAFGGNQPDGLSSASMAYDAATGQLVLFGGRPGSSNAAPASNTWEWQDGYWNLASPAWNPGAVAGASMSYDEASHQLVLYGGEGSPNDATGTWFWDGDDWTHEDTSTSPGQPYYDGAMAYDPLLSELVLYGGTNSSGYLSSTWAWNGSNWGQLQLLASPGGSADAAMAYDPATDQLVLYGGVNAAGYSDETWLIAPPTQAPGAVSTQAGATAGQPQVTVSWTSPSAPPAPAISQYEIFRGTSTGSEMLLATVPAADTSFTDKAVTGGDTYYYYVVAINPSGTSPQSSEVMATAPKIDPVASPVANPVVNPIEPAGPTATGTPTIAYTLASAHPKTKYGWYRSPVTVTFHCDAAGLTLTAPCPAPFRLGANRRDQTLTRTIKATDGATALVHVRGINIDATRPALRIAGPARRPFYTKAPAERCVASDRISGIASCRITRAERHGRITYTAVATSWAGVTTTRRITVTLRKR